MSKDTSIRRFKYKYKFKNINTSNKYKNKFRCPRNKKVNTNLLSDTHIHV